MRTSPRTPKILGADVELGNYITGMQRPGGTGALASRALLHHVDGVRVSGDPGGWREALDASRDPQDVGRRFLTANSGCVYIDLDHLELALCETTNALDHAAYWRAMILLAREATTRANAGMPDGCRIEAVANNSDGLGQSYGSHVNVMLSRDAWDQIVNDPQGATVGLLAAFQVSSIVFTGQGKVGAENNHPWVPYQISQRADFMETVRHYDTTRDRPIVNTRDEPLCGGFRMPRRQGSPELARLHVIFYDSTLCEAATVLRAGTLQVIVAMLEAGWREPSLLLRRPLAALRAWSRDPRLRARAQRADGRWVSAVGLQQGFLEAARRFADRGGFDGIVPQAAGVLQLWADTLDKLQRRDFAALERRLDWMLKWRLLQGAMATHRLTWRAPAIKALDQLYANLDEDLGLYWAAERAGLVDRLTTDAQVVHAAHEPPLDTRAWTRTMLMRRAGASRIRGLNWDRVELQIDDRQAPVWLTLDDPSRFTAAECRPYFDDGRPLAGIVAALRSHRARVLTQGEIHGYARTHSH